MQRLAVMPPIPRPWLLVLVVAACAARPTPPPACPPCECVCPQAAPAASVATPGPAPAPAARDEIQELARSAARRMNHDDGKGCLADLDRLQQLSPSTAEGLVFLRGQCEMLAGACQAGKQRIVTHMQVETNTHVDRANATAEAMAAMYCRAGDSSDRDRLLGALHELMTGAYTETRTAAECRAAVTTIRTLLPKVQPRDADDHQVAGAGRSLYATASNCFARAGDCKAAWQLHGELFPQENLKGLDPKVRGEVLTSAFDSLVPRCKGKR